MSSFPRAELASLWIRLSVKSAIIKLRVGIVFLEYAHAQSPPRRSSRPGRGSGPLQNQRADP
jgi:hypothetical protein